MAGPTPAPRLPSPGRIAAPSRVEVVAARFALVLFTGLWTWWALSYGAFFGTVLYPGGIILYLGLATLLGFAPIRIRGGGLHELAFLALVSLTLWTIVSFAWTPARDQALEDAQRTLAYAAAFGGGLWLAVLLRRRLALAVAPFALACAAVCTTIIAIGAVAGDPGALLDEESTLDFPFGYRNATAAFLVMAAFVGIAIAARPRTRTALRCTAAGFAAAAASLSLLCQSRGTVIAALAALVALALVGRERTRTLAAVLVVVLPAGLTTPWMLDPFSVGSAGGDVGAALQTAVLLALLAGVVAAALTFLITRVEPGSDRLRRTDELIRRGVLVGTAIVVVASPAGLVATGTDPVDWVGRKLRGSETQGGPQGSRFTFTGDLERSNFWSVAWHGFTDSPFTGDGAGGFRTRYLKEGDSAEEPRDAHSIQLELLSELGLPGLLLLGAAVVGAVGGAVRSRRLGPEAAFLTAVAVPVWAVWFGQGAIDWFWSYAGLGAPVFALLGSASAPQALALEDAATPRRRRAGIAACVVVSVTLLPLFLSERLTREAAKSWRGDPEGAYSALDTAADLNPFADAPLLLEAEIARRDDRPTVALDALERARTRQPEEYANYEIAARTLARTQPEAALREVRAARELNPGSSDLRELQQQLRRRLRAGP